MNTIRRLSSVAALMLTLPTAGSATPSRVVVDRTETALLKQMRCQDTQVARAINAMLRNKIIRYKADEGGAYMFVPNVPLKFLGLRILHISGFDYDGFNGVPSSRMFGTAPPVFLEIDVAAPTTELKSRALSAGLREAVRGRGGFQVSSEGYATYLAGKSRTVVSSITCVA